MSDPYAAARDYRLHTENHHTHLHHTNHAHMTRMLCPSCTNHFDVGYERVRTQAFARRPLCFDCVTKETP